MKHGVNVIRSALKGADLFSPKGQRRQQPRNQCGFSAAAVGTGNQNAVQCFFHTIPTKTAAAKLTAAVCFPKNSGGVVTPPKETYTRRLLRWRAICQVGKGETTKNSTKAEKNAAAHKLPQPYFCVKSRRTPVLAGCGDQTVSAGILTCGSSANPGLLGLFREPDCLQSGPRFLQ